MAEWIPEVKPDWWDAIKQNSAKLTAFLSNPVRFLRSRFNELLVGALLGMASALVGFVKASFGPLNLLVNTLGRALVVIPRTWNAVMWAIWRTIRNALLEVVGVGGPVAPFVATLVVGAITFMVAWATYRGLVVVAKRIPGFRAATEFIGL